MAKIDLHDDITYNLEQTYHTFRDDLAKLATYLPDIEDIIVEKHERTDDDTVSVVNLWKASANEIPKIVSKFITPDKLQWTDYATWHDGTTSCDWNLVLGFFPEAIKCKGTTTYSVNGDKTHVHITGDLHVDASKIPGVPRLLSGKLGSAVEKFVVKMVTPNLKNVNRGMERYLAAQPKEG